MTDSEMLANKILDILLGITAVIIIPFQIVSTFVLGILVSLTFGLLLLPISFLWAVFFFYPLIGLSFFYEHVMFLRFPVAVIGIPLAIIADSFVALMPSMGDSDSRYQKMVICQTFPYTWRFLQVHEKKRDIKRGDVLLPILENIVRQEPLKTYLRPLFADIYSRSSFVVDR